MPWEYVGDCGEGQMPDEREWVVTELELAIRYLEHVCGKPPAGCELGIMWQEHDLGAYPSIGLLYEYEHGYYDPPWDYISKCEVALQAFNEAVNWSAIHPDRVREQIADLFGPPVMDREARIRYVRGLLDLVGRRIPVRPRRTLTSYKWRVRPGERVRRGPRRAE